MRDPSDAKRVPAALSARIIRPCGRRANANVTVPLHDRDMSVTPHGQVDSAHCGRDRRRRKSRRLHGAGFGVRRSQSVAPLPSFGRPGLPRTGAQEADIALLATLTFSRAERDPRGQSGWGPVPLRARPAPRCGSRAGRCQQRDQHNLRAILRASKNTIR